MFNKAIQQKDAKGSNNFRYSRSAISLPLLLLFLFVTANLPSQNHVESTRKAILFGIAASVLTACLFLPDGLILQPSKYLWKAITGICIFYLCVLIYLLYQDKQSAVDVITTYFDPSLKILDYEEVSYAQDCRIIVPESQNPYQNISWAFFDLFAVAHFLGWFFKTLICRDFKLVMFASISFQMIEYSLRNVLNNFKECWWDHIIVDTLGCNFLGILCGFWVINKFKLERFKWSLREAPFKNSTWQNLKYFLTHWEVSGIEIKAFSRTKKFIQMTYFILLFQANDLALFFIKYVYGIPPSNFMCLGRVWIVGLLCVNAAKEYYDFMIHKERYIRINSFLVNFIIYTEFFIVFKQGKNDFQHAYVDNVGICLLSSLALLFLFFFVKLIISDIIRKTKGVHLDDSDKESPKNRLTQYKAKLKQQVDISKRKPY